MPYANNKGADQPAHPRSLISTFVVLCLDSIIPLVSISKISSLYLASVAAQAGLCLTWSQISKTGFLVTWHIWVNVTLIRGHPAQQSHELTAIAHSETEGVFSSLELFELFLDHWVKQCCSCPAWNL